MRFLRISFRFTVSLQPWITPSIFDNTGDDRIVDEWTFGQYMNPGKARQILKDHWDTWITEEDFAQIAAAGYVVAKFLLMMSLTFR
jgi:aryl-phospho-beta-D-glucosidase BglC (GH1 family)